MSSIEITEVVFLTPAIVRWKTPSGQPGRHLDLQVDLVNRKVYFEDGVWEHSDLVFAHLDEVNTLPEDFFAAPEEVAEQADRAARERDSIQQEFSGDMNV